MHNLHEMEEPLLLDNLPNLEDPYQFTDLNFDGDYLFGIKGTSIEYMNIKDKYIKSHQKLTKQQLKSNMKESWMRIADGKINIKIENTNPGETIVKVFVRRTDESLKKARAMNDGDNKFVKSEVALPINQKNISLVSNTIWDLNIDLDDVYSVIEDDIPKEVYKLSPSNIHNTNKFQLSTEVYIREYDNFGGFNDKLIAKRRSQPFLVRTEQRKQKDTSDECSKSPESSISELSPASFSSSGEYSRKRPRAEPNLLPDESFNSITANEAKIKHLFYKTQKTTNRDIAYHVKLNDPEQYGKFEEGDVVVFLETEDNDTAIELLSAKNRDRAKLAGVITRSYYLAAAYPKDGESTINDVVCVVGIVKIKTLGPVNCGEHLYAAPNRDGVAIGQSNMSLFSRNSEEKPLLLGQALESKTDVRVNEEVLVSSFVSIILGIGRIAIAQTVSASEEKMKENFDSVVKGESKKVHCRNLLLKILLLVILAIISLALWQRYAPNTLFRKSFCKHGSTGGKMWMMFSTSWQEITVNCLEFEYPNLATKLYKKIKPCPKERCGNGTIRYFMNFDRCSNRGVTFGNEFVDDTPTVSGPEIIGINEECQINTLHYFINGHWVNFLKRHKRSKPRITCYSED